MQVTEGYLYFFDFYLLRTRVLPTLILSAAPQIIGMIGSSYPSSGGPFSQSQLQSGNNPFNSLGMLKDGNSNDTSPYDMSDFPLLSGQPNSAGGPQAQYGKR